MAKYKSGITTEVDSTSTMRQLAYIFEELGQQDAMEDATNIMRDFVNQFVPMKTGALRASARVQAIPKKAVITWGGDARTKVSRYAHYQYEGTVYATNYPVFKGRIHTGKWISKKGVSKVPTDRRLGEGGSFIDRQGREVIIDGYTTPGTTSHWIEAARQDPGWRTMRLDVTKYYKKRLKETLHGR